MSFCFLIFKANIGVFKVISCTNRKYKCVIVIWGEIVSPDLCVCSTSFVTCVCLFCALLRVLAIVYSRVHSNIKNSVLKKAPTNANLWKTRTSRLIQRQNYLYAQSWDSFYVNRFVHRWCVYMLGHQFSCSFLTVEELMLSICTKNISCLQVVRLPFLIQFCRRRMQLFFHCVSLSMQVQWTYFPPIFFPPKLFPSHFDSQPWL